MNIPLRYKIYLAVTILAGVFVWGRCSRAKIPPTTPKPAVVLPKEDKEQIIVNPIKHTITVVTAQGATTQTLPERNSTIDVRKDGMVKVTAPQYGRELRPFAGVFFSDHVRLGAGLDCFYLKKLDLGFGLANMAKVNPVVFAKLSLIVYSNTSIGITYDNLGHIGGCITLKI
jgi:hypothetical protein